MDPTEFKGGKKVLWEGKEGMDKITLWKTQRIFFHEEIKKYKANQGIQKCIKRGLFEDG